MADQAPLSSNAPRAKSTASPVTAAATTGPRTVADSVCLGCGCLCDDIDVQVATDAAGHQQIVAALRACEIGLHWFGVGQSREPAAATCRIAGKPARFDEAIRRAAEILIAAQAPLVVGLSHSPTASQRAALALAEQLGAAIDSATSRRHAAAQLAMQAVGEVTCTWGEIAARSDLVICWGADPVTTHPRNLERYSREPTSPFLPRGRADRTLVVVDTERTPTADVADQFIALRSGGHFDALWTLRALVQGIDVDDSAIQYTTGVPLDTWRALVEWMKAARYGAVLLGDRLEQSPGAHLAIEALLLLVRELNDHTRFVVHGLGSPGNAAGCDEVFTWTTGYPFAVDFRGGYPRYNPDDGSAALLLARGEVDAVLSIGDDALAELPRAASKQMEAVSKPGLGATAGLPSSAGRDTALRNELALAHDVDSRSVLELLQGRLPLIALDWRETATLAAAMVAFRVAQPGVATGGTVYRSDGVPLALRPAISATEPTEADVLAALLHRVLEIQSSRRTAEPQKAPS